MAVGPNSVERDSYDFEANKDDIVATLDELGKAVVDTGLTPVLHKHTGTCVETAKKLTPFWSLWMRG